MSQCAPHHAQMQMLKCYRREIRREGRARHPYLGKALGYFACALRIGQSTRDIHFKHESELHGNGESGIEPGTFGILGER